jgi:hypothetical protein
MEFSRHSSARVALAVALVAVAEMTVAANLDSGSQPVIVVRVDNLGGVRADHLQVAEDRASAIFSGLESECGGLIRRKQSGTDLPQHSR